MITGCDTGFGFSLAMHSADTLASQNILTIATCYRPDEDGCKVLQNHPKFCRNFLDVDEGKKLFVLPMDVTDEQSLILAEIEVQKILEVICNGLVVKGGDSYQKVVSSNPRAGYWMDIFHFNLF